MNKANNAKKSQKPVIAKNEENHWTKIATFVAMVTPFIAGGFSIFSEYLGHELDRRDAAEAITATAEAEFRIITTEVHESEILITPTLEQTHLLIPDLTNCINSYWTPDNGSPLSSPSIVSDCWLLSQWGMYARSSQDNLSISGLDFSISGLDSISETNHAGIYYDITGYDNLTTPYGEDFSIPVYIYVNELVNGTDCDTSRNSTCDANIVIGFGNPLTDSLSGRGLFLVIRSSRGFTNILICSVDSILEPCDTDNEHYSYTETRGNLRNIPIHVEFNRLAGVYSIRINNIEIHRESTEINRTVFWIGYISESANCSINALVDLYPE